MNKNYQCNLDDLFLIFDEKISDSDIVSAELMSKISSAIVKKRLELNMNQKRFADFLGVNQSMVSKWESSDYNFSIKSLADIAVKLDLEISLNIGEETTDVRLTNDKGFEVYVSDKPKYKGKNAHNHTFKSCEKYVSGADLGIVNG